VFRGLLECKECKLRDQLYRELIDLHEEQNEQLREIISERESKEGKEKEGKEEERRIPIGGKRTWGKTRDILERRSAQRLARQLREEVKETPAEDKE
jgi:hypothetical protein